MRPFTLELDPVKRDFRSVMVNSGNTKVLCYATLVEGVPHFLKGSGKGWLNAEYSMLPCSSNDRVQRDIIKGKLNGRTVEIQRLIGRTLRSSISLKLLGERSIIIDCDVLQADGGSRAASISGGYVALALCIQEAMKKRLILKNPLVRQVAAISLALKDKEIIVDPNYEQDSSADVDINIVMNDLEEFIEVQASGEANSFSLDELKNILVLSKTVLKDIMEIQNTILGV